MEGSNLNNLTIIRIHLNRGNEKNIMAQLRDSVPSTKLFIICAIVWQICSLVYFSGLWGGGGNDTNREVWLLQQQQQLDQPQRLEKNALVTTVVSSISAAVAAASTAARENPKPTPNATLSNVRTECFPSNSDQWISSGNIFSNNANGITPELLNVLLEGPRNFLKLPSVFAQTICHEGSPLRNFSPKNNRLEASAEDWYHRFLYLSLHWRFHRPAFEEHQFRKRCAADDLKLFMDQHNIQTMDFECPGEKFLVIPVGSIGFGAFLNTQASLSILLALRTNRIPIFTSKSFYYWQKRKGVQDPWLLAPKHCTRKDLQCYFLPISPCTVTNEELEAAPIYGSDRKEQKFLHTKLTIPPELESSRIVVVNSGLEKTAMETQDMRKIASLVVDELLGGWKLSQTDKRSNVWSDEDLQAMDLAHEWVTNNMHDDTIGLLRQVYVYMLRPNPHYKDILNRHITELVPRPILSSETIGIPIRGSDKCKSESMCLPFDRYMELATDLAYPELESTTKNAAIRPKLIMTTEDPRIFNNSLAYQRNNSFPFELLVNENDNMQGSGYPKEFSGEGENTIVSSLTALKFHFHASRVYLNCCSNFHVVLNYLLQGQCGVSRHGHDFVFAKSKNQTADHIASPVARCMTDEATPRRFRICCRWSKSNGGCGDIWKEYLSAKEEKE